MYRTDASDEQQRIERLERELNLAYEQQQGGAGDSEVGLALLRFRAHRLTRDIASLRARRQGEPLWRRLVERVKKGSLRSGFIAGVGAVSVVWGVHASVSGERAGVGDVGNAEGSEVGAVEVLPQAAEATATVEPSNTSEPETTPESAVTPEPPEEARAALSAQEYEELLAHAHAFFRAVEGRDGRALARLSHPLKALELGDEQVSFTPALLRDCFANRRLHSVRVNAAGDETVNKTCGEIFADYGEAGYERAPDVTFNEVPPLGGISASGAQAPFVFFDLPGAEGNETLWRGVQLVFERYGSELVLTAIHKAYWTP